MAHALGKAALGSVDWMTVKSGGLTRTLTASLGRGSRVSDDVLVDAGRLAKGVHRGADTFRFSHGAATPPRLQAAHDEVFDLALRAASAGGTPARAGATVGPGQTLVTLGNAQGIERSVLVPFGNQATRDLRNAVGGLRQQVQHAGVPARHESFVGQFIPG